MKRLILIAFTISLFHNFAHGQWVLQHTGIPTLYDIQFVNRTTGWAIGVNSTILKTTNGGENWFTQQSNLASGKNLIGLSMTNTNTGYIAGWFESLLKTTNGGENWIALSDGPVGQGNSWNSSCFINSQTGWICGFLGAVKRTTNGGTTWDSLNAGGTLRDIQFLNSQTGWVAGDGGYIRKTTNAGNTWQVQFQGTNADYWYNSLSFLDINTGWAIGRETYVFRTTNAGLKWDTLSPLLGICLTFVNEQTGWAGGNMGRIYKTTNNGFNWIQQTNPSPSFSTCIEFYNDTVGWSTISRQIIQTLNGGTYVGISSIGNEIPITFKLYQNYPNPFNPSTQIKFALPQNTFVTVKVYNAIGEEVARLVNNEFKSAGSYSVTFDGSNFGSGIYFYSIEADQYKETKKMVLIK